MNYDIGSRIRRLRKVNKLDQRDLAKKLNVSINAISQYETNKRLPDIITLKLLADMFDVTLEYFLNDEIDVKDIKRKDLDRMNITEFLDFLMSKFPEETILKIINDMPENIEKMIVDYAKVHMRLKIMERKI